jgi:LacI family transcriptional regulator
VILSGYDPGVDYLRRLQANGGRVVSLGRLANPIKGVPEIVGRHEESMYWATLHLLDHGCRRIVLVNGPYSLWLCNERLAGFRRAHHDRGLSIDETLLVDGPVWKLDTGRHAARAIIAGRLSCDGVLCCGDWATFGLITELRQLGCEPGRDLPMVTGDWYQWLTEATGLELTGLHEPRERLAATAMTMLTAEADVTAEPEAMLVAIDFIVRATCGCGGTRSFSRPAR